MFLKDNVIIKQTYPTGLEGTDYHMPMTKKKRQEKGTSSKISDIDLAVIIKGEVEYEDELKAMKLRRNIDL